jgi:transposase-like protein
MKAMANHRTYSVEFKRQIVQDFMAGETLHTLARRHDISRNLVRLWVRKFEAGAFDDDAQAADLLQDYEAKIAALERMVGRQALEIEFLKGALKSAPRPRSASTSWAALSSTRCSVSVARNGGLRLGSQGNSFFGG